MSEQEEPVKIEWRITVFVYDSQMSLLSQETLWSASPNVDVTSVLAAWPSCTNIVVQIEKKENGHDA